MTARKPPAAAAAASARHRLLIVDDHPMMREGLAQLINHDPGLTVCGEAGSGREALELVSKLKPSLVLAERGARSQFAVADLTRLAQEPNPSIRTAAENALAKISNTPANPSQSPLSAPQKSID